MKNIPLSSPDITDAERDAVLEVLRSRFLSLGPKLGEFEEAFAAFAGTRHAVAVNSGTSALHLCVKALGLGPGDEVITSPFSFVASVNCLLYEGVTPVLVDVDPGTFNLDVRKIEARITKRTKAILPVHVFGHPCEMDVVMGVARKRGLKVLEDACEAIGATYRGKKVGTFGDCATFAFYPNKQMTTGEGGMVVTDDEEIARLCRSLRNQGRGGDGAWLSHPRLGYNYRLCDIQCALGLAQIRRIGELLEKRRKVAGIYNGLLKDVRGVRIPVVSPDVTISWFVYVVLLEEALGGPPRDGILQRLRAEGIGCNNYFPPIHVQPYFIERFGDQRGAFPVTENISARTIALPFHGSLDEGDVRYVVEALKKAVGEAR